MGLKATNQAPASTVIKNMTSDQGGCQLIRNEEDKVTLPTWTEKEVDVVGE